MKSLRDDMLAWGRRPPTPGIYRFRARMDASKMLGFEGGRSRLQPFRQLSRRSGCVHAGPYPPLSHPQSGLHQPCRAILLQRTATTPLTDCLTFGVHFTEHDLGLCTRVFLSFSFPLPQGRVRGRQAPLRTALLPLALWL